MMYELAHMETSIRMFVSKHIRISAVSLFRISIASVYLIFGKRNPCSSFSNFNTTGSETSNLRESGSFYD